MKQVPGISIITIVYNRLNDLQLTASSVWNQSYSDIEYIIIDGGSTDGCAAFIEENTSQIDFWVSEPDKGIYDAMNKGLRAATKDYVLFMNAGDTFTSQDIIKNIFSYYKDTCECIYSDTRFVDINQQYIGMMSEVRKRPLRNAMQWKDMKHGMLFCHQSFIVKRSIAPMYNLSYKYSADIDWIISCMKKANCTCFYNEDSIANFQMGGASHQNHAASLRERFQIYCTHFGLLRAIKYHIEMLIK